jgi:hypothetical protein
LEPASFLEMQKVFIPFGKVIYREAAARIARHIAKVGHREQSGPPTLKGYDFLNECLATAR